MPTAPTAVAGTNTTQLANTAFVQAALSALVASSPAALDTLNELALALGNDANFATTMTNALALKAPLASPTFTGTPLVPTAAADTATTQTASTAFVIGQAATANPVVDGVAAVGVSKRYARQDHVHPTDSTRAPLASPTFTGTPAVPTAAVDTATTQVASTAFVTGQAASANPLVDGVAAVGVSTRYARQDHVHPTDTTRAPLASPALTGTPTAPTAVAGTNTTQLANTAFVQAAISALVASSPATLDTLNELALALGNDANFATTMTNALAAKAPLASPGFTGTPTAPTAATGNSTTQIATTAFVSNEIANDAPTKTGGGASGTWGIAISGNAGSATKLATPRSINGATFDGSADITIGGVAKAWVNFTGTGTVTIRKSFNVSSITDNGVGDYTINFTTPMADADYAVVTATSITIGNQYSRSLGPLDDAGLQPTASAVRLQARYGAGGVMDPVQACVSIYR